MEIESVETGANCKTGDFVYMYVHSVVRTFFADYENMIGLKLKVGYLEEFKHRYHGKIIAEHY